MPTRKRFDSMSARDTGLEYLLRRLDRLEGNPGLSARSTGQGGGGSGGVDPTFLVAASDASPGMRAAANWVCTGGGDHVEIQDAFDSLPLGVGRVQLTEGIFDIPVLAGGVSSIVMPTNSELVGTGPGTVISYNGTAAGSSPSGVWMNERCVVENLRVDLAGLSQGTLYGIYMSGDHCRISGVHFTGVGQSGQDEVYYASSTADGIVANCHFEDIYLGGC